MSKRACVIDLPGLSRELLRHVPADSAFGKWLATQHVATLSSTWPAVTCSVQATLTTGTPPAEHGIISNGIATYRSKEDQNLIDASNFAGYRRDVSFWEQSNQLVERPRFWQDPAGGRSRWKTALLFFQNSMPGFVDPRKPAADIVITPKPEHGPDGKITSLLWTEPRDLVPRLFKELGPFPLMNYWGPLAKIESSRWIAAAATSVWQVERPDLQLTYVPHLDYDLQRFGPDSPQAPQALREVSAAVEPLVNAVLNDGAVLIVLSEYAMQPVSQFVQPNVLLRDAGLLVTRSTDDGRLIDYARSAAFAMVDHQIAHIYVRDRADLERVRAALQHELIEYVDSQADAKHRRSGELLIQAIQGAWFDYRWWTAAADAPKFAAMVDIHRKAGYDACELFFDPATRGVSQNPAQVRGSHGRLPTEPGVIIGAPSAKMRATVAATDVGDIIRQSLMA